MLRPLFLNTLYLPKPPNVEPICDALQEVGSCGRVRVEGGVGVLDVLDRGGGWAAGEVGAAEGTRVASERTGASAGERGERRDDSQRIYLGLWPKRNALD